MSQKRLARKIIQEMDSDSESESDSENNVKVNNELGNDLHIVPYTEKSFVVMGSTLNHSKALVSLGGKYNTNLKIGQGWIFAKVRQESVENYLKTGEIVPYVYSQTDKNKYATQNKESSDTNGKIQKIFLALNNAFNSDDDYEGSDILNVINQIETKFK